MAYGLLINFSYINYSSIAARVVRKALKPEMRAEATKRSATSIKFVQWKDGKPISKFILSIIKMILRMSQESCQFVLRQTTGPENNC